MLRTSLLFFVCVFTGSLSLAETDSKGSVIPSLQTLGKETPLQPELMLVDHAGPIKVEVRKDLRNPEKHYYRPLFYLDIDTFNDELEVCEGVDASFEPQDFFLEFTFPNLSERLAQAIEMASQSGDKVQDTDVLGVPNLGLEIRFKGIFDDQLIYQDISEDLLLAGPLPTSKTEAVNGRTCRDWYRLKKFLERGAERFEANVFVWSTDNTVPKSIDVEFKSDVLEKIENEIFGQANYSIVFDENRGGSERKENSFSNSQTRRSNNTGSSYSVGANIPVGSFNIGGEASFSGGSLEKDDSSSSTKSSNYENIKNRLTQTVSGSRILSRDYITSFGLDSVSGFSIKAVNFSAPEAADQIQLCLKAREHALDYVPVRLELNDQNKAVLTTREFREQIGVVDLQANDIQRLKAAGGLDLDVTVLDRTALREAMQCDFSYSDQESRPTGKWKLTYYPKQVADAWKEKQKAAQVDATVEELAADKFAELVRRMEQLESKEPEQPSEIELNMEINGASISNLAELENVLRRIVGQTNQSVITNGVIELKLVELERVQIELIDNFDKLAQIYSDFERIISPEQAALKCIVDKAQGKKVKLTIGSLQRVCGLTNSSKFVGAISCEKKNLKPEPIQVYWAGSDISLTQFCTVPGKVYFFTRNGVDKFVFRS